MTHDELLAKIDEGSRVCELDSPAWSALRAVMEAAKNSEGTKFEEFDSDDFDESNELYDWAFDQGWYSAMREIIQAIEKELK